jgi:hypothetical protein
MTVYNKDTVGYSCEQRWFNLFVDIQAQQDALTQDKGIYMIKSVFWVLVVLVILVVCCNSADLSEELSFLKRQFNLNEPQCRSTNIGIRQVVYVQRIRCRKNSPWKHLIVYLT